MVSFLLTLLVSQIATLTTHELARKEKFGPVRSSSLLTLCFVLFTFQLPYRMIPSLQAAFLGASFVGMTDPKRLGRKELAVAGLIFTLFFHFMIIHLRGLGGALGLSAFLSCLVTYVLFKKRPRRMSGSSVIIS